MKRWSYTLLTIAMLLGTMLLRHSPVEGANAAPLDRANAAPLDRADAAPAAAQEESEFVPTEKLPADATISFPVDI